MKAIFLLLTGISFFSSVNAFAGGCVLERDHSQVCCTTGTCPGVDSVTGVACTPTKCTGVNASANKVPHGAEATTGKYGDGGNTDKATGAAPGAKQEQ